MPFNHDYRFAAPAEFDFVEAFEARGAEVEAVMAPDWCQNLSYPPAPVPQRSWLARIACSATREGRDQIRESVAEFSAVHGLTRLVAGLSNMQANLSALLNEMNTRKFAPDRAPNPYADAQEGLRAYHKYMLNEEWE